MDIHNPFHHQPSTSEKVFKILIQLALYLCVFLIGYITAKMQTLLSTF